jgi:hypothetical protein
MWKRVLNSQKEFNKDIETLKKKIKQKIWKQKGQ